MISDSNENCPMPCSDGPQVYCVDCLNRVGILENVVKCTGLQLKDLPGYCAMDVCFYNCNAYGVDSQPCVECLDYQCKHNNN
eukprot:Pgem_evm1s15230